jgi:hypothetical protein
MSGLGWAGIKELIKEWFHSKKAIQETPLSLLVKLILEKVAVRQKTGGRT